MDFSGKQQPTVTDELREIKGLIRLKEEVHGDMM